MRDLPSASVIVPTYGRPESVLQCVVALSRSEYPAGRLDIIIVDDGSPEPVALDRITDQMGDVPVRVIRQANTGPAGARNWGAREATGEVLAFTDDDCRPSPDWLVHLVRALEDDKTALVGGTTHNALKRDLCAEASQTLIDYLYSSFATARELRPFFTSNNICAYRQAFWAVGGFDESFPRAAAEDRDLSERWQAIGRLVHVPEALVWHYHDLGLLDFLRQHHTYGRGAEHLARVRRSRGSAPLALEPIGFYLRMLRHPFRAHGMMRGTAVATLLFLSQAAAFSGVVAERYSAEGEPKPPAQSESEGRRP